MKKLMGLMLACMFMVGCLAEEEFGDEVQGLEALEPDGIPQNPSPEPPPLPVPTGDASDDIPQPPPWPGPRLQCDEGPHCCPDPRNCPPILPK